MALIFVNGVKFFYYLSSAGAASSTWAKLSTFQHAFDWKKRQKCLFFPLLVLFKNKSPPNVKKPLAELYSKNSFKKTKIMQSLNVVVRSQIARVTGNQGVAWLTAKILSAKHWVMFWSAERRGKYRRKTWRNCSTHYRWSTPTPFLVQFLHVILLYNILSESLHSTGLKWCLKF